MCRQEQCEKNTQQEQPHTAKASSPVAVAATRRGCAKGTLPHRPVSATPTPSACMCAPCARPRRLPSARRGPPCSYAGGGGAPHSRATSRGCPQERRVRPPERGLLAARLPAQRALPPPGGPASPHAPKQQQAEGEAWGDGNEAMARVGKATNAPVATRPRHNKNGSRDTNR